MSSFSRPVKSCGENLTASCFLSPYDFFHIAPRQKTVIFCINEKQRPYFSFMVFHIRTTPWHSSAFWPCSWQGPELSSNIGDGSCQRFSVSQVHSKKMEG